MIFRPTTAADSDAYFTFSADAQALIRSKQLKQWVPTAHEPYRSSVRANFANYVSVVDDELIGCFQLLAVHSTLADDKVWPNRDDALYVNNIVVRPSHHGRNVGTAILDYCVEQTRQKRLGYLHLTAENTNNWLCAYYERHHFYRVGTNQSYDDYYEFLYERDINPNLAKAKPAAV